MATFLPSRPARPVRPLLGALRPRRAPGTPPDVVPQRPVEEPEPRSSVVAAAIYDEGVRTDRYDNLADALSALRSRPGGTAWIWLERPHEHELTSLAGGLDLHSRVIVAAV